MQQVNFGHNFPKNYDELPFKFAKVYIPSSHINRFENTISSVYKSAMGHTTWKSTQRIYVHKLPGSSECLLGIGGAVSSGIEEQISDGETGSLIGAVLDNYVVNIFLCSKHFNQYNRLFQNQ